MIARSAISVSLLCLLFTGPVVPALALDDAEQKQALDEMKNYRFKNVATPEGLNFSIPEDMPLERKNGLVAPISFDEYFYYKFKKMEEKMSGVEKKIDHLDEILVSLQKKLDKMAEFAKEKPVEKTIAVAAS